MPTSGTYTFRAGTRDQIIASALRKVGALAEGDTPSGSMLSNAAYVLETVIAEAEVDGMPLWAIDELEIPLTSLVNGQVTIGIGSTISVPQPLKLLQVILRRYTGTYGEPNFNTFDQEIFLLTRQEFNTLSTKLQRGDPINYFYNPSNGFGTLRVWPAADPATASRMSLILTYQRPFQDAGSGTNDLDFPSYWSNALIYTTAVRLAPEYGVPPNDRQLLNQEAQLGWARALSFGTEEGSLYLAPDNSRGGRTNGGWGT